MGKHLPILRLKPGREKAVLRRHPWIFSGAVGEIQGEPGPGESVLIQSSQGDTLALAAFSPASQIRCRIWDYQSGYPEDIEDYLHNLIEARVRSAFERRAADPNLKHTSAYRLLHAESDRIPGLIADMYGGVIVVQFLSMGVETRKAEIVRILEKVVSPDCIFERSDHEVRALEGLPASTGALAGILPDGPIIIEESSLKFTVDIQRDQKTGHYLDQRQNRQRLSDFAGEKKVLDCFSGTGGFSLRALEAGAATVVAVDSSAQALDRLGENCALNNLDTDRLGLINQDVFQYLRALRDRGESFDLIILDPPKFAPTRRQVEKASRAYKDINLLAMKLLEPGGVLFTFSCSGGVDAHLFQQIVAGAALDSGFEFQICERLGQASDHPVLLSFPEGNYLKGLICKKI